MGLDYSISVGIEQERRERGWPQKGTRGHKRGFNREEREARARLLFLPPRGPGTEACKRDKPMFAGVFGFCKRDIRRVCHACKGEHSPMFIVLVTLSRFRFPAAVRTDPESRVQSPESKV